MSSQRKFVAFLCFVVVLMVVIVGVWLLVSSSDTNNVSDGSEMILTDVERDSEKDGTSSDASFHSLFEETSDSKPSGIEFAVVFESGSEEPCVVDAVYRDVSTGVMYVWIDSGYSGTGLSVMLNAEGAPLIYHDKTEKYDFSHRFKQVYDDVFVDTETKVMYLRADGAGHSGISVMFGSDGKPLTYKEGTSGTSGDSSEGQGR